MRHFFVAECGKRLGMWCWSGGAKIKTVFKRLLQLGGAGCLKTV